MPFNISIVFLEQGEGTLNISVTRALTSLIDTDRKRRVGRERELCPSGVHVASQEPSQNRSGQLFAEKRVVLESVSLQ